MEVAFFSLLVNPHLRMMGRQAIFSSGPVFGCIKKRVISAGTVFDVESVLSVLSLFVKRICGFRGKWCGY